MSRQSDNTLRGSALLANAWENRGSAFASEERDGRGLRGLLPVGVSTLDDQVRRVEEVVGMMQTPLSKYLYLESVRASDEPLFFEALSRNIDEYMAYVYTPTVGEACQRFSHIFRHARGLYVSAQDRGHVRDLIANVPNERVDMIVVTDGQRILGLGDLGVNGMGIPIGKLALYTACAGIHPQRTLPVTIDVGTNNEEFLADPLYLGLRHKRITGPEYDALIAEFIEAASERWPGVIIQFEDFHNSHAFDLLDAWKDRVPCFNDDIQGTASVCVAGFYSAMRVLKQKLSEQRILFLGAGSAATGIGELLATAMGEEDLSIEEGRKRIFLIDSKGLVTTSRMSELSASKQPFAKDLPGAASLLEAINVVRPTAIVGVSAQGGAFTPECLQAMAQINERPIVFALSNPTTKAECTAEQAYRHTGGRALFACGSPFAPVTLDGKTFVPRQGNNSYVFPGIGLGCVVARTRTIPMGVFLTAARELANMVSEKDLESGSLYPALAQSRQIAAAIGTAVATYCFDKGLSRIDRPDDIGARVQTSMWNPADPMTDLA